MEELEKVIEEESVNVLEKDREEWKRLALRLSKLCLERGDSVENIKASLRR